jgi:phosphoglycerate dehydrogenase-like enzyme
MAEYVLGAFLHFSRDLHRAEDDRRQGRLSRATHRPVLLAGQTACVIGVGGIGREVGRLGAALGMRVVGTTRSGTGEPGGPFAEIAGPDRLHDLLAQSRYVAVCCQWTPETDGLRDRAAFAALPEGAVVANVARGEVIDQGALLEGLDRLRGVALDVYAGEFDRPPPTELWQHPKVVITPHTSASAEEHPGRPLDLFCRNLASLIAGRPLENVIDWARGY